MKQANCSQAWVHQQQWKRQLTCNNVSSYANTMPTIPCISNDLIWV